MVESLEPRQLFALYLNDIDSLNLGKGMWAWTLGGSQGALAADGFATNDYAGWFNFLRNQQGLDYVIIRAARGDNVEAQYTPTVVNAAHAAGLKVFPYFYVFGDWANPNPDLPNDTSTVAGEIAAFNTVFGPGGAGGDAAIVDIEAEYGGAASDAAQLTQYFQGIGRSGADYGTGAGSRDKLFMAYSTFDNPRSHQGQVPYAVCGDFMDAVMPQMYWKAHKYTIAQDIGIVDADFRDTRPTYLGSPSNIKPVIPTGQAYSQNATTGNPTAAETTAFFNAIVADTNAVGPGGAAGFRYKSINYFDQRALDRDHTLALTDATRPQRAAIAAQQIGDLPGAPALPGPAHGQTIGSTTGVVLNWSDVVNTFGPGSVGAALYYDVYVDDMTTPRATIAYAAPAAPLSQWTVPTPLAAGTHQWKVVARNMHGSTSSPVWTFTVDTAPPTAAWDGAAPEWGSEYVDFTVTYADAAGAVDLSSLGDGDVTVLLPGDGGSIDATLVDVDVLSDGSPRVATYRIAAPGGSWNRADNGTYQVRQAAGQVRDTAGNFRPAGALGAFDVSLPAFAQQSEGALAVHFVAPAPVALWHDGTTFFASCDGETLEFTGVASVHVNGSPGPDVLQLTSTLPAPVTYGLFDGGGDDEVQVIAGSHAFPADLSPTTRNVAVTISAGATAVFESAQHLRRLTVNGSATAAGGTLVVADLAVTGRLDLRDHDLIWDYDGASPVGAWDGVAYTGVSGLVAAGRNGGDWSGVGIVTSMSSAAAPSSLTTLAVADAGHLFGLGASDTTDWAGHVIDGSSVLVKYTYAGDADLNGALDSDDYFAIDSNFNLSGSVFGWNVGDFDLNGSIDSDDYFLIDSNFNNQVNGIL